MNDPCFLVQGVHATSGIFTGLTTFVVVLPSGLFTVRSPWARLHRLAHIFSSQNPPFLVGGCVGSRSAAFMPSFVGRGMDILAHR